jgi:hypothetical protein
MKSKETHFVVHITNTQSFRSNSTALFNSLSGFICVLFLAFVAGCSCPNNLDSTTQIANGNTTVNGFNYLPDCHLSALHGPNGTTTYAYTATTATVTPSNPADTIVYTVDPTTHLATSDSRGATYEYDSNGYLIKAVYPTFTDTRTIVGGNIVTEKRTGVNPVTYNFTYTTINNSLYYGMVFLGKANANMPLHETEDDGVPPTDFSYELDSKGRVAKQTRTGGINDVSIYKYRN